MKKYLTLFQNVKFNVYLFCALALSSVLGTLIPQNREVPDKVNAFVASHPTLGPVLEKLSFFDIYYSWWFIALLCLMAFNVVVCKLVFGKFPGFSTFKNWEKNPSVVGSKKFQNEFEGQGEISKNLDKAAQNLREGGYFVEIIKNSDDSVLLLASKHRIQRFGSWVSHICILLILLSNIIGYLYGFRENLEIPEGSSVMMENRPWVVECEDFVVDFYKDTPTPKTFSSDLRIFKANELMSEAKILVNEPLEYEKVRFYQATYAPFLKEAKIGLFMKANPEDSTPAMLIPPDVEVSVPGTPYKLKILHFLPDFFLDENRKASSRSPNLLNPAIKLLISKDGQPVKSPWIFVNHPGLQMPPFQAMEEFIPVLAETIPEYFTGIQVTYDPGADLFWSSCTIFVVALMILFYLHHRRFWVWIGKSPDGKGILYKIGGDSSRGSSFEAEFENMISKMKSLR